MNATSQNTTGLTAELADRSRAMQFRDLTPDALAIAKQCVLDWFAVTFAGAAEPLTQKLAQEAHELGGNPQATVLGLAHKSSVAHAALVNGAASHALDYDDVNMAMIGHPTVAVLPGLLALAEHRAATGAEFLTAFMAGYETACRIGKAVGPGHYATGFHATATVGGFGAAAACARLLQLDAGQTRMAFGIAATQAAGLKSMFGTMCKPLHAGNAALNGLLAATRAARGFDSAADSIECAQGFAATHSPDFFPDKARSDPRRGFHIRENLFKYHAACYLTHSAIECASTLRGQHQLKPGMIASAIVHAYAGSDKVCNIPAPRTGLETKFSLRATTAFALAGLDTSAFETFSDANANDAALNQMRDKITVALEPDLRETIGKVDITLKDGRMLSASHDSGIAAADIAAQGARITAKARSLMAPVIGANRAGEIIDLISRLETLPSVAPLAAQLAA